MTITLPAFAAVLLIVALHTILSHLLNWGLRTSDNNIGLMVWLTIIESAIIVLIIYSILT